MTHLLTKSTSNNTTTPKRIYVMDNAVEAHCYVSQTSIYIRNGVMVGTKDGSCTACGDRDSAHTIEI